MNHNQALACWHDNRHGKTTIKEHWHVMAFLTRAPMLPKMEGNVVLLVLE